MLADWVAQYDNSPHYDEDAHPISNMMGIMEGQAAEIMRLRHQNELIWKALIHRHGTENQKPLQIETQGTGKRLPLHVPGPSPSPSSIPGIEHKGGTAAFLWWVLTGRDPFWHRTRFDNLSTWRRAINELVLGRRPLGNAQKANGFLARCRAKVVCALQAIREWRQI